MNFYIGELLKKDIKDFIEKIKDSKLLNEELNNLNNLKNNINNNKIENIDEAVKKMKEIKEIETSALMNKNKLLEDVKNDISFQLEKIKKFLNNPPGWINKNVLNEYAIPLGLKMLQLQQIKTLEEIKTLEDIETEIKDIGTKIDQEIFYQYTNVSLLKEKNQNKQFKKSIENILTLNLKLYNQYKEVDKAKIESLLLTITENIFNLIKETKGTNLNIILKEIKNKISVLIKQEINNLNEEVNNIIENTENNNLNEEVNKTIFEKIKKYFSIPKTRYIVQSNQTKTSTIQNKNNKSNEDEGVNHADINVQINQLNITEDKKSRLGEIYNYISNFKLLESAEAETPQANTTQSVQYVLTPDTRDQLKQAILFQIAKIDKFNKNNENQILKHHKDLYYKSNIYQGIDKITTKEEETSIKTQIKNIGDRIDQEITRQSINQHILDLKKFIANTQSRNILDKFGSTEQFIDELNKFESIQSVTPIPKNSRITISNIEKSISEIKNDKSIKEPNKENTLKKLWQMIKEIKILNKALKNATKFVAATLLTAPVTVGKVAKHGFINPIISTSKWIIGIPSWLKSTQIEKEPTPMQILFNNDDAFIEKFTNTLKTIDEKMLLTLSKSNNITKMDMISILQPYYKTIDQQIRKIISTEKDLYSCYLDDSLLDFANQLGGDIQTRKVFDPVSAQTSTQTTDIQTTNESSQTNSSTVPSPSTPPAPPTEDQQKAAETLKQAQDIIKQQEEEKQKKQEQEIAKAKEILQQKEKEDADKQLLKDNELKATQERLNLIKSNEPVIVDAKASVLKNLGSFGSTIMNFKGKHEIERALRIFIDTYKNFIATMLSFQNKCIKDLQGMQTGADFKSMETAVGKLQSGGQLQSSIMQLQISPTLVSDIMSTLDYNTTKALKGGADAKPTEKPEEEKKEEEQQPAKSPGQERKEAKAQIRRFLKKYIASVDNKAYTNFFKYKQFVLKEHRRTIRDYLRYKEEYAAITTTEYSKLAEKANPKNKDIITKEVAEYNSIIADFDKAIADAITNNQTFYTNVVAEMDKVLQEKYYAHLDYDVVATFNSKISELRDDVDGYRLKLISYININYSMADIIIDSQFIILYVCKAVRILFSYLALFLTVRTFIPMIEDDIYNKKVNPRSLHNFILIFIAYDLSLNTFLFIFLFLLKYMFGSDANVAFPINGYFFSKYFVDYGIGLVTLVVISLLISSVMMDKKLFQYKYQGARTARALSIVMFYLSIVIISLPMFMLF